MASEREFLTRLDGELSKLRAYFNEAVDRDAMDMYLEGVECMVSARLNTTPAAPAAKSMDDKRAAACSAIHDYCEGVEVEEDAKEAAEIDFECWEELENVREIEVGLRGHFPDMVRKMIHVVRMEAKHEGKGEYLTDSIILRLLRSIAEEDRLPDRHPIRMWAGQRIPKYT